ncbi:MAG: DUF3168 domain-containing protein [Hyphomonadaceae bacterium]
MSADRALGAAIRAAAMADAGVRAVLGDPARAYDDHPPDPVFPYATFGRFESRPANAAESDALEHVVTLHVWSRYGGRAEALDALNALRAALHNQDVSVAGRRLVFLYATYLDAFRAGDGVTTHGVLRLRALTEPE